jgi:hypothetical protein
MPPICFNAGIIEIESPDFAGLYPATLAASTLRTVPRFPSAPVSLHVSL